MKFLAIEGMTEKNFFFVFLYESMCMYICMCIKMYVCDHRFLLKYFMLQTFNMKSLKKKHKFKIIFQSMISKYI